MKLVIISHTEHYKKEDGTIVGWGSTINELNHLIEIFDEIIHVAMLHPGIPPQSSLPYTSSKIKFVALPPVGGKSVINKLQIILNIPKIIRIVSKNIKDSDVFQLRTPTGIGVFLIPYLSFFVKTRGWYKYAGNWKQENPPLGYRLQRWMLKSQSRKVTVNGLWKNKSQNILAFENPCLTDGDRIIGDQITKQKELTKKGTYCFVGGLSENKGIDKIFEAFMGMSNDKIDTLHVVGDGVLKKELESKAQKLSINVIIHGSLSKNEVQEIYKSSHFILLPSQSEGFPKVIGEAMNYGCIPIVSKVSCINQYIKNDYNGFLIHPITSDEVRKMIFKSIALNHKKYTAYITENYKLAEKFTYNYYLKQIQKEILKNN